MSHESSAAAGRAMGSAAMVLALGAVSVRPLVCGLAGGAASNAVIGGLAVAGGAFAVASELLAGRLTIFLPVVIPFVVFVGFVALSASTTDRPRSAMLGTFDWFIYLSAFVGLVIVCRNDSWRRWVLATLLASAAVVIANGVHQRLWGLETMRVAIDREPGELLRALQVPGSALGDLRARTYRRVFSTFLQPNALAAYLAMVIASSIGVFRGLVKARGGPLARVTVLLIAVSGVVCLYLTGSKGGMAAALAGLAVVAVLTAWPLIREHRRAALAVAVPAAVILCGVCVYGVGRAAKSGTGSLGVRIGYWRGAARVIAHAPLRGVGYDNFGNYYARFKTPTAQETLRAHNDYLQLWCELGAGGILAFIVLWAFVLRNVLRGATCCKPYENRRKKEAAALLGSALRDASLLVGLLVGVLTFALAGFLLGPFWVGKTPQGTLWLTAGFFALWMGVFVVVSKTALDWQPVRAGLAGAIVALLVHAAVDFDFYEHGLPFTVFSISALTLAAGGRVKAVRLGLFAKVVGLVALGLIVVGYFGVVSPRIVVMDRTLELARAYATEAIASDLTGRDRFEAAYVAYGEVLKVWPWSDEAWAGLGDLHAVAFKRSDFRDVKSFREADAAYQRAIELNRSNAALYYHRGILLLGAARSCVECRDDLLAEEAVDSDLVEKLSSEARPVAPAATSLRQALRWNPTSARYHASLGLLYADAGLDREADEQFRLAVHLDEIAPMPQMRLKPEERYVVQRRMGLGR